MRQLTGWKRYAAAVICGLAFSLVMGEISSINEALQALAFCSGPAASSVMS